MSTYTDEAASRSDARALGHSRNSRNGWSADLGARHSDAALLDLLTTEEVAQICRRSPGTVRWWRYNESGPPGFLMGKRVMYPRQGLHDWISNTAVADATRRDHRR